VADQRNATVLIVEDDTALAQAFARALRNAGYQAWIAGNAEDGLRQARQLRPDVILLDFRMPLVNGVGFLYRLRTAETDRRTPVVVITGEARLSDEVKAQLRELSADVRFKPITLSELIEATREALGDAAPSHSDQRLVW